VSVPRQHALQFAVRYRLRSPVSEPALDRALVRRRIDVIETPADFIFPEFRCGRVIAIRADVPAPWRLWLKAHALGHYLMHRGDQILDAHLIDVPKQERQAEEFAGWLLLGGTWRLMPPWELAEYHDLPEECIRKWLGIVTDKVVA
jgi:hypothetical protein